MQQPGAEQHQRDQPPGLRTGPVQAAQPDARQAKRQYEAQRPPPRLAKQQRERHRQQQQDHPGERVRVKHVPEQTGAVPALHHLHRELPDLGRSLRRKFFNLLSDLRREILFFFSQVRGNFCGVKFAGLNSLYNRSSSLFQPAEMLAACIEQVGRQAKRRAPKHQPGQSHPCQHKQSKVKRRDAGAKVDHRGHRRLPVDRLEERCQLPAKPAKRQPRNPTGQGSG